MSSSTFRMSYRLLECISTKSDIHKAIIFYENITQTSIFIEDSLSPEAGKNQGYKLMELKIKGNKQIMRTWL